MKETTKEDVIEVINSIDNPAVLEYLYQFIIGFAQRHKN